jgi:hypothetical protein
VPAYDTPLTRSCLSGKAPKFTASLRDRQGHAVGGVEASRQGECGFVLPVQRRLGGEKDQMGSAWSRHEAPATPITSKTSDFSLQEPRPSLSCIQASRR